MRMLDSALIIIDMQNDFVKQDSPVSVRGADKITSSLQRLLDFYRKNKALVVHVIREYRADGSDIEKFRLEYFKKHPYALPGSKGAKIIAELTPVEGEIVLIKNRFSAFLGTELDLILRRNFIRQLVVAGIQYPNCLRATIFDAVSFDYDVTVIYECATAANKEVEEANIVDLKNVGVNFVPLQEYMNE